MKSYIGRIMKTDPNSALAMRQEGVRADNKSVSLAKLLLKSKMVLFSFSYCAFSSYPATIAGEAYATVSKSACINRQGILIHDYCINYRRFRYVM